MHRKIHDPHKEMHRVPADLDRFWVITVLSNPIRYKRRYELYWKFAEMCKHAGVNLITVEQAFGDRQFMVTETGNPLHLQLRSFDECWHKENLINLGVKHAETIAPGRVREIAWVDADCRPARSYRDWFEETWHQLQHYQFVQMWENLIDLDYSFNPIGCAQPSFMANYIKYGSPTPEKFRELEKENEKEYGTSTIFGRPGLAWAANVSTGWNPVGGLPDFCILGAGDWYAARALIGALKTTEADYINGPYYQKLLQWQERAVRWIKKDVGYVQGLVFHDFHGHKKFRFYGSRGKILANNKYNPDIDIKYDSHGQLQLETWDERQMKLRDDIRAYYRSRNEDSIDL
jgi:hypothetical protein